MHPELLYTRPYHEAIEDSAKRIISQEPIWEVRRESDIVIRHHGYGPGEMQRKLKRGLSMMETCLKRNPNDAFILGKLGGLHSELGNSVVAERYLKKALEIAPDSLVANYHLALFLQEHGDVDGAIRLFRRVVERDAGFREAYNYLGVAYAEKGWIEEAIVEFEKAIAIDANFPEARNNLGVAYAQMGMTKKAESEFKKAVYIDPFFSEAHKNLAIAYFHQTQYALAKKHCEKAISLGFDVDPDFLQALSRHRETKGDSFNNHQGERIKK
jgi:tetratricopeptide (TPR) repeat protein